MFQSDWVISSDGAATVLPRTAPSDSSISVPGTVSVTAVYIPGLGAEGRHFPPGCLTHSNPVMNPAPMATSTTAENTGRYGVYRSTRSW